MKWVTSDDLGWLALEVGERVAPRAGRWAAAGVAGLDRTFRRGRRRRIERNLRLFQPELDEAAVQALVRRIYRERWTDRGDRLYREWLRAQRDGRPLRLTLPQVEGFDRLQQSLERGRGVILWESPFGSRTWLHLVLLSRGVEFTQAHGAEHSGSGSWLGQNVIRGYRRGLEARCVPEIVEIQEGAYSYLRTIKRRLAENRVVLMPGLGPKGRRFLRLRFLGGEEHFATGVAGLAAATGAALLPVFCFDQGGGRWKAVIEEAVPVHDVASRDDARTAAVELYARTLEAYIRRRPSQWRRWHAEPISPDRGELSAVSVDRTGDDESSSWAG